ncbi:hypothetical protein Osc7112_2342 [Oscillatoria nigro-viridis PCC 7112]|uniref:Uncharacterized protein n=1 Tax=Phormidium nigroviride PCC 7112 TaxID=179408 RepID=K9VHR7_9CYAN|nr:hypothetical protein Osc7112_2342 [Oscillatoria nigro-viridis PCC 7112]
MELSCSSDYLGDAKVIKFSFLTMGLGRVVTPDDKQLQNLFPQTKSAPISRSAFCD